MFELLFSGMVHVVDSVLSKSVWRCLPLKTSYKSTDQFHFASNIHWKLFQARVSHDSVIYKQKAITDKASSACVLTNKIKHILRLWKYQFINITKITQSESINILTFDFSVIKLKRSTLVISKILSTVKCSIFANYIISYIPKNCKKNPRRIKDYMTAWGSNVLS